MAIDNKNLRHNINLRITVLNIIMFFTLWSWIVAVNSILRRSIDRHFPVPVSTTYGALEAALTHVTNRISHTVLSFELIALLFFFPCFLVTRNALARAAAENPQALKSGTRKKLIFSSLFFSVAAVVGTIFFAGYLLFTGNFTINFGLKIAVLFTFMGSVFGTLRFPKRDDIFFFIFCASACIGLGFGVLDFWQTQAAAGTPADEAADRIAASKLVALPVHTPTPRASGTHKMSMPRTASKVLIFLDKKSSKILKGAWKLKNFPSGSVLFRRRPDCRYSTKIMVRGLSFSIAVEGSKASVAPLRVLVAQSSHGCPFSASPQRDIFFDLTSLHAKGKNIDMTFAEHSGGLPRLHATIHATLRKGRILSGGILFRHHAHGSFDWKIRIMVKLIQDPLQRR
jgi:hypothetical protein